MLRPSHQWATASSRLGLPADLSPFQKLFWLLLLTCSSTTQLFRACCFIDQGMGSLQRGCWAVFVPPLHMPDSLLSRGYRALGTLLLKHVLYNKLLPWCSVAFKSLIMVCLHLYSMLAQREVQSSPNKPAPGSCSASYCVICKIASKSVWNDRKSVLFWSESFWTCKKPCCCAKAGHR